jgi:hypothetical protein
MKMIESILLSSMLLVGQTAAPPQAEGKPKATPTAAAEDARRKAESEYNLLKEKTPMTATARMKLALWCEEHGLSDLAYVHFGEVISIDPKREAAWKKLGFKKYGNQWLTDAQIADDQEQKKADKLWGARLKKVHKDIHGGNGKAKQKLAQAELDKISDPRAIASVYREFRGGDDVDQFILLDVLSQIVKPVSSKVLALIAVYGKSQDVRERATKILRDRPSKDFIDVLVGLMTDEYKYEVRPVAGPGSAGVLFVEGEKFNVRRFYAPPAAPNITPQPGDTISYDQNGNLIIGRAAGQSFFHQNFKTGGDASGITTAYAQISPALLQMEAQRAALAAQDQLEGDVNMIKAINQDRRTFNEVIMTVAKDATGQDGGKTPKEWRESLEAGKGRNYQRPAIKPTYGEMVALEYNPAFEPIGFTFKSQITDT